MQWVRGVKYRFCPWQPCPLLRIPWRARTMGAFISWMRSVTTTLKEALAALADALAERPAEEILFDWFRSGRLVGELSVLIKRKHPEVQAEIDRVYQEHLAKLGKRRRDPARARRWIVGKADTVQHPPPSGLGGRQRVPKGLYSKIRLCD